eukprot:2283085-Rhodomonas_salina.1
MSACIETATSRGNLTAFASGLWLVRFKVRKAFCVHARAVRAGLIGPQRLLLSAAPSAHPRPSTLDPKSHLMLHPRPASFRPSA